MIKRLLIGAAMLTAFASASAQYVTDRMVFPATNGNVVFFHNNHVNEVAGDCAHCHDTVPPGKIAGFGADYAHKFCVGCHSNPADGEPEGPTKCEECHKN